MKPKTMIILMVIYVLVAVVTYGHAYSGEWASANQYQKDNGCVPGLAFFESLCWPLYWSQQFWK